MPHKYSSMLTQFSLRERSKVNNVGRSTSARISEATHDKPFNDHASGDQKINAACCHLVMLCGQRDFRKLYYLILTTAYFRGHYGGLAPVEKYLLVSGYSQWQLLGYVIGMPETSRGLVGHGSLIPSAAWRRFMVECVSLNTSMDQKQEHRVSKPPRFNLFSTLAIFRNKAASITICYIGSMFSVSIAAAASNLVQCWLGAVLAADLEYLLSGMGRGWWFCFFGLVLVATSPLLLLEYCYGINGAARGETG